MIPAICFLLLLGLTAMASGAGLAAWIWPASFRGKGIDLTGMMMLGFGLIALAATYLFLLDFTVFPAVPIALAISCVLLLTRFIFARADLQSYLAHVLALSPKHLLVRTTAIAISIALVLPGVVPYAGQQFRLGNDQYGYGMSAQYLRDGGTLSALRAEIIRQTGQANLPDALHNSSGALSCNLTVEAEFLLKANRVGYPAMIGAICQFLHQPLIYPDLFLMLFWPTYFLLSILWFFFRHAVGSSEYMALGYALALSLNCNLLNNACEGQQAQCFAAPYICLFFVALYIYRGISIGINSTNQLALTAALGTCIVLIYAEALSALACAGVVLFLIDLCLRENKCLVADLKFGTAIAIGLVTTGPFFAIWFPGAILQASLEATGNAGYWQPYWATPAEIMGWIDIYTRPGFRLDENLFPLHFAAMIASVPLLGVVTVYLLKARTEERAYWLAPMVTVAGVFVLTYFIHPSVNYGYMKAYTLLFFPLCVPFYLALDRRLATTVGSNKPLRAKCLGLLCAAIAGSILTGGIYLVRYNDTAQKLPENITELRDLNRTVDFRNVAIITPSFFDLHGHYNIRVASLYQSLGMVIPFNWLNAKTSNLYLVPYTGIPIDVLILKSGIPAGQPLTLPATARIVFENSGVLLIDTGFKLAEPTYQLHERYVFTGPPDPSFEPGCSDSQQYQWKKLLQSYGVEKN